MTSYLISGGTGSFGQAFVKRILANDKTFRVVVYSRDELKQFEMQKELKDERLRFFIGDVRDESRLKRAFKNIDVVVHAAALKQVPAAEYNPDECVKTNVFGTQNVINAALDVGVPKVIALSTDKVCSPISLYGSTKLCAERLLIAANNLSGANGPKFSVIRYGNFIDSRGSITPIFRELAKENKPLPITDLRMTRFWMLLDDAAEFAEECINAMKGGEIFVPKLEPLKLTDIAKMYAPDCQYEIIGIRQGEKLHEILVGDEEVKHTRDIQQCYIIDPVFGRWKGEGKLLPSDFRYTSETAMEK